jgi:6-pyruvoyltetrahydropterin/6-carboxytetrahydropterin synthase
MMNCTIVRKSHFNAAHRLYHKQWSDEKNLAVFGKCAYPNYHGHNYEILVKLTGPIQEETGFVYDLKSLADLIEIEICERFDHKNLNLDVPDFQSLIPTAENICVVIWNRLRTKIDSKMLLSVTLYETERNFVEYHGPHH